MSRSVTCFDIAEKLSPIFIMDAQKNAKLMEMGSEDLALNQAVLDFAVIEREKGRKTALIIRNLDVFSNIIMPAHCLDDKFYVLANSF